MRKIIHPLVLATGVLLTGPVTAQFVPDFLLDESKVRAALAYKVFDAPSAQISELLVYPAPDGSTSDVFVCGTVNAKDAAGQYAGEQNLAVGVKGHGADAAYSALGVGEVASYFCDMVATP